MGKRVMLADKVADASACFEIGRFYRRNSNKLIYRCEQARDSRVLLHLADILNRHPGERRVIGRKADLSDWLVILEEDEAPFLKTYMRDVVAEYGAEVGEMGMAFRRQYYFDPYLDCVAETEIKDRIDVIADNIVRYSADGTFRLLTPEEGLYVWQRKAEEVMECLRVRQADNFFTENSTRPNTKVLKLCHDIRLKRGYSNFVPWRRVPELPSRTTRALFKFGKSNHLRDALVHGKFRIRPASFFSDPSLNVAQRDNQELSFVLRPSKTGFPIVGVNDRTGKRIIDTSNHPYGQIALEIGGDRDYYAWSCSKLYEPRLYIDFEADACLVIHDHHEFARRLNKGLFEACAVPGMYANDVRYYDPFCPDDVLQDMFTAKFAISFYKDLRYAYQQEYRFIWPVKAKRLPSYVDIEVGPMDKICDLLELK
jgi:hypothetical protein